MCDWCRGWGGRVECDDENEQKVRMGREDAKGVRRRRRRRKRRRKGAERIEAGVVSYLFRNAERSSGERTRSFLNNATVINVVKQLREHSDLGR